MYASKSICVLSRWRAGAFFLWTGETVLPAFHSAHSLSTNFTILADIYGLATLSNKGQGEGGENWDKEKDLKKAD